MRQDALETVRFVDPAAPLTAQKQQALEKAAMQAVRKSQSNPFDGAGGLNSLSYLFEKYNFLHHGGVAVNIHGQMVARARFDVVSGEYEERSAASVAKRRVFAIEESQAAGERMLQPRGSRRLCEACMCRCAATAAVSPSMTSSAQVRLLSVAQRTWCTFDRMARAGGRPRHERVAVGRCRLGGVHESSGRARRPAWRRAPRWRQPTSRS